MKKQQKRIFRDRFGRFTSDGRKVKTLQIGKRIYKKKSYVKKIFKTEKRKIKSFLKIKRPIVKTRLEKIERLDFKTEIYQTQIGKLSATHTQKFEYITDWLSVDTTQKMIKIFKTFFEQVKPKTKKVVDVKFGITVEDIETQQFISKFTKFYDLIFDTKEIKNIYDEIKEWVESLKELGNRYMVQIKNAIVTLIIYFRAKGHLE